MMHLLMKLLPPTDAHATISVFLSNESSANHNDTNDANNSNDSNDSNDARIS